MPIRLALSRILLTAGLVYCLILVWMYVRQDHFIYFPETAEASQWRERAARAGAQIIPGVNAIVVEPPVVDASTRTALYFHGNDGNAFTRLGLAKVFNSRGYRLVLAEYPGFGPNPGKPSQATIVPSAMVLMREVSRRWPGRVTLVGESLGSGVAAQIAAAMPERVDKLVLITPFTSLRETAAQKMWFIPVSLLLKSPFDSSAVLKNYHGPSSVLVAGQDDLVGPQAGLTLQKQLASQGPSTLVVLPQATHDSWISGIREEHWDELLRPTPR
jgi:pimeloyl-ACP methyl ester carboxylesterase